MQQRLELSKQMEPPRFMKPINGLDVPEGGQAVFEVVVAGQPLPEVAWYHEGRPIQHGPDFQVSKRCRLNFDDFYFPLRPKHESFLVKFG